MEKLDNVIYVTIALLLAFFVGVSVYAITIASVQQPKQLELRIADASGIYEESLITLSDGSVYTIIVKEHQSIPDKK